MFGDGILEKRPGLIWAAPRPRPGGGEGRL